jgi:hypothetical protein
MRELVWTVRRSVDFSRELRLARMEFDDDFMDRDAEMGESSAEAFVWFTTMLKREGSPVMSPEMWIRSWAHILRRERRLELDLGIPLVDLGGEG